MKGRIPSNIDLDYLVSDLKGKNGKKLREDSKGRIMEGMVYILNQLTFDVYNTDKRKDGYKKLNKRILEDIIGKRIPTTIKEILLKEGVIETKPYINKFQSTGYRLTTKYCTGEFKEIEYSDRINNKLIEYQNSIDSDFSINIIDEYEYPKEQFTKNELTVKVFESNTELRMILVDLLGRTLRKKKYKSETIISVLNLIGGYKHKLDDFKNKEYRLNLSSLNLRFNTNLTSLKKELRQFLRVNGEKLVEVDIKSSQPFILSTILNPRFTNTIDDGYNLFTIYPELYDEFQKVKSIIPSNTPDRTEYILGVHFTPGLVVGLQKFTEYNFENDFYENILVNGRLISDSPTMNHKVNSKGRSFIKKHIMNYLFERNEDNKFRNFVIEKINSLYPELTEFIERFHSYYGNTKFSYLLQRTESYLVLNWICGYLNENHPEIPFFTIHDSILTTWEYSTTVKDIMTEVISEVTGKTPVISIKENLNNIDIEETWGKVNITNEDKFEKRRYSISRVDVQKGLSLINDQQLKSEVKDVIKPHMKNFH